MVEQYTFKWPAGPQDVIVTGTFDNWQKTMPLVQLPDGSFEVTVPLKSQDKIMYKYIVDGEWLVSPTQRVCSDEHGIDNNYIDASDLVDSSTSGSRIPEAGGLAFGGAAVGGSQSKAASSDAPKSDSNKSAGSRIPEAGGLVFGGAAAQQSTPSAGRDLSATVMPVEPLRQQTLGEPGVVIPQGDQLKAFETVRNVDPATLNQPESNDNVTGVAIPQGDQLKAFETVRHVDPATLNQSQDSLGADGRELTPEERKKQKKKVKRTQYKRKKKQQKKEAAAATTSDSSPEPEEAAFASGALHHEAAHPDGPKVAEDKRELAQDIKNDNTEPHPDRAFSTDPFLEAPHDGHHVEAVGEHIERQLHGDENSPGTVDVSGVTQPISADTDPSLKAAEKNHNVEKEGEHLEELLVGDAHPNASTGTNQKGAVVGTGLHHEAAHPDGPKVAEDKRELAEDVKQINTPPRPDVAITTDPYLKSHQDDAAAVSEGKSIATDGQQPQQKSTTFDSQSNQPEYKQAVYGSDLDQGTDALGTVPSEDAVFVESRQAAVITNDAAFVTETLVAGEIREGEGDSEFASREFASREFITPEPRELEHEGSRDYYDSQKPNLSLNDDSQTSLKDTKSKDVAHTNDHHDVDGVNPVPLPVVSAEKHDIPTTEPKTNLSSKDTEAIVPVVAQEKSVPSKDTEAIVPVVAQETTIPANQVSTNQPKTNDGPITERGFNAPDAHQDEPVVVADSVQKNVNPVTPANDDVYAVPEPTVKDVERPKTLDPKGSEPTLLKDGVAPSQVEPPTVEEEIVVADGTASRKQIEKEIQAVEGKNVVLEEFTPNAEIAEILEAEAVANDPTVVNSTDHAKTIVVEHDPTKPVDGKTSSKTAEATKTTADGKDKSQATTSTKKPATSTTKKPATSTAKKTTKEPEKKKGRFSRMLKKIFS